MSFYMYANLKPIYTSIKIHAKLHMPIYICLILDNFTYIPSFMPFYTYIKIHSLHVYKAMPNSHRSIFSQIYVSIFLPYFT